MLRIDTGKGPLLRRVILAVDDQRRAAAEHVEHLLGLVMQVLVLVVQKRRGVHGKQMGDGDASVLLQVAPGADLADPSWDWVASGTMQGRWL